MAGQILAVVSQKGGVGKTTTAVNLAGALAMAGMKTLLVDVDPQGSVRYGIGLARQARLLGFADYLAGRASVKQIILPTVIPQLRAIVAGTVIEEAEHEAFQKRVAEAPEFAELLGAARERSAIVIVDTPPGLGPLTRATLAVSQRVLVPLQCEPLALQTTPQILRSLREAVRGNANLTLDGLLLTMFEQGNPLSERIATYVREQLPPDLLLDVVIPRSLAAADAFAAGQPVVFRTPEDGASEAYRRLAEIIADRVGVAA